MSNLFYKKIRLFSGLILGMLLSVCVFAQNHTLVLTVDQAITPPVLEYIEDGIDYALESDCTAIILQLDTPGGLYSTTRSIGQAILNSPIPVMTYVSPQGARASSAGTFILYASHIAAMAPSTHLGSATPVSLAPSGEEKPDDASTNKVMEDTQAYMRSLAQYHQRNQAFGIQAITEATSLTAEEALANNAIEIIAKNTTDLLQQANGRSIKLQNESYTLNTKDSTLEDFTASLKQEVLFTLSDPTITYLLLMAGIYGLLLELFNPGSMVPGVIGAICILIAGYSLQILPINYAGLGLLLLGTAFLTAEAFIPSFGIFGLAGIVSLAIGSFFLFTGAPWARPSIWIMLTILLSLSAGFLALVRMTVANHWRPPVSGLEGLVGMTAKVIETDGSDYTIRVMGQVWAAKSNSTLSINQQVIVTGFQGLIAIVTPTGDSHD